MIHSLNPKGKSNFGKENKEDIFNLVTKFNPCGDQPQAIEQLVEGFNQGKKEQTLLGVTGSGKTFTMAEVSFSKLEKRH